MVECGANPRTKENIVPSSETAPAEDFREYRAIIRYLLESKSTRVIPNSSQGHASVIIEEMVRHAGSSFLAVAQRLNPAVWGARVVEALSDAISNGIDVSLLVVDGTGIGHTADWPETLRSRIRRISAKDAEEEANTLNFAVMDGNAIRIEFDKGKCQAAFCANNEELAGLARRRFEALSRSAEAAFA